MMSLPTPTTTLTPKSCVAGDTTLSHFKGWTSRSERPPLVNDMVCISILNTFLFFEVGYFGYWFLQYFFINVDIILNKNNFTDFIFYFNTLWKSEYSRFENDDNWVDHFKCNYCAAVTSYLILCYLNYIIFLNIDKISIKIISIHNKLLFYLIFCTLQLEQQRIIFTSYFMS